MFFKNIKARKLEVEWLKAYLVEADRMVQSLQAKSSAHLDSIMNPTIVHEDWLKRDRELNKLRGEAYDEQDRIGQELERKNSFKYIWFGK